MNVRIESCSTGRTAIPGQKAAASRNPVEIGRSPIGQDTVSAGQLPYLNKMRNLMLEGKIAIRGGKETNPEQKDAVFYHDRGLIHAAAVDFEQAIVEFSRAITLDPKNSVFYYDRGLAYFLMQNFEQALADLSEAVGLDPKNPTFYHDRGMVYHFRGILYDAADIFRAISDYSKAIALNPKDLEYQESLKLAYADYSRAITLDPDNPDARLLQ